MKYIFVVNPNSGQGIAGKIANNIKIVAEKEKLDFEIRYTEKFKDIRKIVDEYKAEENIIFGVGGDGLISEVASGIIGTKNHLGVIPAGTGNDFYKSILESSFENEFNEVDIGKINDKYFLNVACVGIDSDTANNLEIFKYKKIPNKYLYNVSIFYTFFKFKYKKLNISYNNINDEGYFPVVTVCNGKYYGGGYKIAPKAELTDGKLDLYYANKIGRLLLPVFILKVKKGKHHGNKRVKYDQIEKIVIESSQRLRFNIDGELYKTNKAEIEIMKEALSVYNNPELVNKFLNIK